MNRNLRNAIIAFLAPLPSIVFYLTFLRNHSPASDSELSFIHSWCLNHPLLLANLLFFLNVNVLFWVIGLLQSSHWVRIHNLQKCYPFVKNDLFLNLQFFKKILQMIDVYWTVIPVMLVQYFASHPLAQYNKLRSMIVVTLTWIWSIRLTHNYFRRENWEWGAREDWRFNDLRKQYGIHWWWLSFFSVYVSQQVTCLPPVR